MKVSFHTLGCRVNQYETAAMRTIFSKAGYELAEEDMVSDVIVINSCTVTAESDRKTRQMVRRLKRENPNAMVVLTGCYPQAFPEEVEDLKEADIITGNRNRNQLPEIIEQHLKSKEEKTRIYYQDTKEFEALEAQDFGNRTRAFIKIEDGCENYCNYCIIPKARGPIRSKAIEDIQKEAEVLAKEGRKEIVLTGINLSAYGTDNGSSFSEAAKICSAFPGIERIRFGSVEPDRITDRDLEILSKECEDKICPHFHLPLQSGSDTVLKRMGRHYNTLGYLQMVEKIRSYFPGAAFTTDMMVGYPGETDQEHQESIAFAKEIGFGKIHVFAYSKRSGTVAATLEEQVSEEIKKIRSHELMKVSDELRKEKLEQKIGLKESVLFESEKDGFYSGYTKDYYPVKIYSKNNIKGIIQTVEILETNNEILIGTMNE